MTPGVRRLLGLARVLLGLGLLAWILATRVEWAAIREFTTTTWLYPALVVLTAFGAAVESVRLGLLCRSQGIRLPFWAGCRVITVATFFNLCIPGGTGGDVMKLYLLASRNRGKGVELATVLLVDRAVGLFTLLLTGLALSLVNLDLVARHAAIRWLLGVAGLALVALVAVGLVACSPGRVGGRLFDRLAARLPLGGYLARGLDALRAFRDHRGALLASAVVSLVGHASLVVVFLAAGSVLLPGAEPRAVGFLAIIGMLANALPLTPGGLGVGEAAFAALFGLAGHAGGAALLLAWRAAILPFVIAGALLYVVHGRGRDLAEGGDTPPPQRAPGEPAR